MTRDEQALAWANANPNHPESARVKAKAEAALANSQSSQTPQQSSGPVLEGLRPEGSNPAMQGLSAALQSLGLTPEQNPLKAAANAAVGPVRVGQTFNEGSDAIGGNTAEFLGSKGVPDAVSAGGGMLAQILSNPLSYVSGPSGKVDVRLGKAPSEGSLAARLKTMRTGVPAQAFDQLRRDPMAFLLRKSKAEAGKEIGAAKEIAGVNLGVKRGDLTTLTPENVQMARTPGASGKKALDSIMEQIPKNQVPSADEVSKALAHSNARLSKLQPGSELFQREATIKDNLQFLMEQVAPEVKEANKTYARTALRDEFMQPFPVNQNGAFSKINAFGFAPAAAIAGGSVAGTPGAILAGILAQAARSPFIAGAGTAARGLADKAIDPILEKISNSSALRRAAIANALLGTNQ